MVMSPDCSSESRQDKDKDSLDGWGAKKSVWSGACCMLPIDAPTVQERRGEEGSN